MPGRDNLYSHSYFVGGENKLKLFDETVCNCDTFSEIILLFIENK